MEGFDSMCHKYSITVFCLVEKVEQQKTITLAIAAMVAALELRKMSHSLRISSPITYLILTTVLLFGTFCFSFHLLGGSGFAANNNNFIPYANAQSYDPCNCVIFRLDDVVDCSINVPMTAIMDHFISENKKLNPAGTQFRSAHNEESRMEKVNCQPPILFYETGSLRYMILL
jgi:hypothetical protein